MLNLKSNSLPLYTQINEYFIGKIRQGFFKPGDRLPPEQLLAERLGVSRMTVNKALRDLSVKGFITRIPGAGTFVNPLRYEGNTRGFSGLMDYTKNKGLTCCSKVIKQEICRPNRRILESLNLAPDDNVYELVRLRYVNNLPMAFQTTYIAEKACPDLLNSDFTTQSLYQRIYDISGHKMNSAIDRIKAIPSSTQMAKTLQVKPNFPLLYITRIGSLDDGKEIELTYSWYRSDQYVLEVTYHGL